MSKKDQEEVFEISESVDMSEGETAEAESPADSLRILEALLFASDELLTASRLKAILPGNPDGKQIRKMVDKINVQLQKERHPFEIVEIGGGYQFRTVSFYHTWVRQIFKEKASKKLSVQALECLAIIAYKQPLSKAEIEAIRGVVSDGAMKTLLEKRLVTISGRSEKPGRPLLYSTTQEFLKYFGLNKPTDLPRIEEFEAIAREKMEELSIEELQQNDEPLAEEEIAAEIQKQEELAAQKAQEEAKVQKSAEVEEAVEVEFEHQEEMPEEEEFDLELLKRESVSAQDVTVSNEYTEAEEILEKVEDDLEMSQPEESTAEFEIQTESVGSEDFDDADAETQEFIAEDDKGDELFEVEAKEARLDDAQEEETVDLEISFEAEELDEQPVPEPLKNKDQVSDDVLPEEETVMLLEKDELNEDELFEETKSSETEFIKNELLKKESEVASDDDEETLEIFLPEDDDPKK